MANCVAWACGEDTTRVKEVRRLGSVGARTKAATWRTFVTVDVRADGSTSVLVVRDGMVVHTYNLGPEPRLSDILHLDES